MYQKIIFAVDRALRFACLKLILAYRFCMSPLLGNHCRFYPSCSHYAMDALSTYHVGKSLYLIMRRLLRCHPFHSGGFDPVVKIEE